MKGQWQMNVILWFLDISLSGITWSHLITHWGRVTHICVGNLTSIGSYNGLSPGRRQAIIWTNAGIFVNWTLGNKLRWNFNQNSNIFFQENPFENVVWNIAAILSRPQCDNLSTILTSKYRPLISPCPHFRYSIAGPMMTSSNWNISALLDLCEGNPPVTGGFT